VDLLKLQIRAIESKESQHLGVRFTPSQPISRVESIATSSSMEYADANDEWASEQSGLLNRAPMENGVVVSLFETFAH
jgi:hypothetical protein